MYHTGTETLQVSLPYTRLFTFATNERLPLRLKLQVQSYDRLQRQQTRFTPPLLQQSKTLLFFYSTLHKQINYPAPRYKSIDKFES